MKERKDLEPQNQENCNESKIYFIDGDYFIECNGKLYKLINDIAVEIITNETSDKD
jgi:hypothetical protein